MPGGRVIDGQIRVGSGRADRRAANQTAYWLELLVDGKIVPADKLQLSGKNGATGMSDIHGNAARVAESESGAERMNATNSSPFLLRFSRARRTPNS